MDPTTSTPGGTTRARASDPGDQAPPGVELKAKAGPHGLPREAGPGDDGPGRSGAASARADAEAALAAVINAPNAYQRVLAYGELIGHLTTGNETVAVWDGACNRLVTLRAFYRACLGDPGRRAHHTADLCRWATAADQPYRRYPLITTSWRTT